MINQVILLLFQMDLNLKESSALQNSNNFAKSQHQSRKHSSLFLPAMLHIWLIQVALSDILVEEEEKEVQVRKVIHSSSLTQLN
jgi:hypothetical protein